MPYENMSTKTKQQELSILQAYMDTRMSIQLVQILNCPEKISCRSYATKHNLDNSKAAYTIRLPSIAWLAMLGKVKINEVYTIVLLLYHNMYFHSYYNLARRFYIPRQPKNQSLCDWLISCWWIRVPWTGFQGVSHTPTIYTTL